MATVVLGSLPVLWFVATLLASVLCVIAGLLSYRVYNKDWAAIGVIVVGLAGSLYVGVSWFV
jgi:fumarate reductase subunit C